MTTYMNDQVISGAEAKVLLAKHGADDITSINGDILDTDGVTDPFEDSDVVVIHCGVSHVSLRVESENFQVFLNPTAKMVCVFPEWTIEA